MSIRTLIVEDEPLAAQRLVELLAEYDWIDCEGIASTGPQALVMIEARAPELVFLDVELPGMSGVDVLRQAKHVPFIVFTTAYDRYATTAFDLDAIDYLTKPFARKRFHQTLLRVRERLQASTSRGDRDSTLQRLFLRKGEELVQVAARNIWRLEAHTGYVEIVTPGPSFLTDVSLSRLQQRLDPSRFLRVHRSSIVNLDHVVSLRPCDERRLTVSFPDGSEIIASRVGSRRLRELADRAMR